MYRKQKGDVRDSMNFIQQYFLTKAAKLLRDRGFSVRRKGASLKINTPDGVDTVSLTNIDGLLDLVDRLEAMFKPRENVYNEPPDAALGKVKKSGQFPEEKLPEHYKDYIMPQTRVDMYTLAEWVEKSKVKNWVQEYNKWRGTEVEEITDTQKKHLIDSITFRIARKIWYVGRKPAQLTDSEWDDVTRKMRPKRGTFSKNEKWTNMKFPYTQSYPYESGKF